ncbi:MAG TPA: hypothetical protein VFK30_02435, partial [Anaerolineae bacterium]|nr:hypothetical protein [Anaerolineae bacterium]
MDNFNRSNEGPPPSASWVISRANGLQTIDNECARWIQGAGDASSWNTQFGADQECFATLNTTAQGTVLYCRLQTATNYQSDQYQITFIDDMTLQFWKRFSSAWTQLGADVSITYSDGDVWGIQVIGDTITAFRNGSEVAYRVDSDVAGA